VVDAVLPHLPRIEPVEKEDSEPWVYIWLLCLESPSAWSGKRS